MNIQLRLLKQYNLSDTVTLLYLTGRVNAVFVKEVLQLAVVNIADVSSDSDSVHGNIAFSVHLDHEVRQIRCKH